VIASNGKLKRKSHVIEVAENARTKFIVDGKTGRGLLKAIINSMIVDGVDADHSDDEEWRVTDEEPNRHGHRHPGMY